MSHLADVPRARREEVRSSAEAALPPPNRQDGETSVRALEHVLSRVLEELEGAPPGPPRDPHTSSNGGPPDPRTDHSRRLFRSVPNALGEVDPPPALDRAWLGSTVQVRDVASSERLTFEIVPLDMVDGSLERVTVASPIGQVLQGARQGDVVDVKTPLKRRAFAVEHVETIWDLLERSRSREMRE